MAATDDHKLGINPEFIRRVKISILKNGSFIQGEDPTARPIATPKRETTAQRVFANPDAQAEIFALHIAANGAITGNFSIAGDGTLTYTGGTSSENDIDGQVTSIWDDRSDVKFGE